MTSRASETALYEKAFEDAGNITSYNGHTYTYGDSQWGDLLTAYDGQSITYDGIGNPTSYYNGTRWSFTWEHGRELTTASNGSSTWIYTYDANGMRTKRTNGSTTYEYVYNGDRLTQMTINESGTVRTLYFVYDASGPIAFNVTSGTSSTTYYYVKNAQGDITTILNKAGTAVVTYSYDAWGNLLSIDGEYKNGLGLRNPLRYRGYVYDSETGFYYLQSRYYDPQIGRFINADALVSTGQGLLGNNMFAYCNNNSVNMLDPTGTIFCKISFDAFAPFDCSFVDLIGGGGGGMIGLKAFTAAYSLGSDGIQETEDNTYSDSVYEVYSSTNRGPGFRGKMMSYEISGPSFSLEEIQATVVNFKFATFTGDVEWHGDTFSFMTVGTAEAGLSAGCQGIEVAAIASLWSPEISFDMGLWDLTVGGYVGGYGFNFSAGRNGVEIGLAAAFGLSVSLEWK